MTTVPFDEKTRIDPPLQADEAATLRAFLAFHRDTFRWKCSGLTQEQLAYAHAPSDMSLGGKYPHLEPLLRQWSTLRRQIARGREARAGTQPPSQDFGAQRLVQPLVGRSAGAPRRQGQIERGAQSQSGPARIA